ncbi:MAG TPA: class I SAM-dependent methyltransferase [Epsilonproteobacteria bacterium]|nr:class I SAM-dependent methyltransferase [Campylobacterota bacterium]
MADSTQIIELYTELAQNPDKEFGWAKGLENAKAHGYKQEWIDTLPLEIWDYCASVGNPFKDADIKEGDTVLDLGCGAGVDVLVSRLYIGESGSVIGVDITPKMVEKSAEHAKLAGFSNIQILENSFDNLTLEDESVDVVISNGAINLTACKESVFAEVYRVLKPDGKIYFADMIDISKPSSCSIEQSACCDSDGEEDWANCVAGTMREDELIQLIENAGFKDVSCTGHTHYTTAKTTKGATFTATKMPASEKRKKHWDGIFQSVDYTQVLWHQNSPDFSIAQIQSHTDSKDDAIIDIGCGASLLVDVLLQEKYSDVTLLDVSDRALEIVKERLSDMSDEVTYICSDITTFEPSKQYKFWHDRAVFHFLLDAKERKRYFDVMYHALEKQAIALIGTFSEIGPLQCSGLDTVQYHDEKLKSELIEGLRLVDSIEVIHHTPKQTQQSFRFFLIKKV